MKIDELPDCIKNSWCIEKHWEALIEVAKMAKDVIDYFDLSSEVSDYWEGRSHDCVKSNLRKALIKLEAIE